MRKFNGVTMFGINKEKSRIDSLLKDIRADYEKLVILHSRPKSLAKQFELRYHDAVEYRINLLTFLEAEHEAVKALLEQTENKPAYEKKEPKKSLHKSSAVVDNSEERISFADKLIQEFAERIEKYPEIIIHPDAAFEMKKLFGALSCIEKDYWATLDRVTRGISGYKRFRDSLDLEPEINRMCILGTSGLPSVLGTYYSLLERRPRNYNEIEREEHRCLVSAARLLKNLQMEIVKVMDTGINLLDDEEKQRLTEARVYIENMMDDFRLKDLAHFN